MSFTAAIDGPAAAGKGTLAKQLAAHFKMAHLDTGLLYRAVARQVLAGSDPVAAAVSLQAADLDPTGLYTSEVAQQASRVAVLAEVRSALVTFQRSFAHENKWNFQIVTNSYNFFSNIKSHFFTLNCTRTCD